MKTKFDADDLNLISLAKEYSSERKARKLFEAMRWPNGKPVCPHCGFDEIYKLTSKKESRTKLRAGVYCCAACRKPFSATVGTVFESSHVPLSKILMAIFILCSSKKSISALQLSRMLKTTYRTSWFLAHRIRHAMATDLTTAKPLENTVEADETFCKNFSGDARQAIVALIVERNGESRTRVIPSVTANTVGKFLNECVSQKATVNTDEHPSYKMALKGQERHQRVNHSKYEYARHNPDGTVSHVNTAESWFSLMKRSVFGAWHCISPEHLPKYASELEYRWNTRHVSDGERMAQFVPLISGKRKRARGKKQLPYRVRLARKLRQRIRKRGYLARWRQRLRVQSRCHHCGGESDFNLKAGKPFYYCQSCRTKNRKRVKQAMREIRARRLKRVA